jgi:hypothetical protein
MLLAVSVCLVQSGAVLVSDNYKLAYTLQTVNNLVFGCPYAGRYLQLPNVKPTQVCSALTASQAILVNYFRRSAVV